MQQPKKSLVASEAPNSSPVAKDQGSNAAMSVGSSNIGDYRPAAETAAAYLEAVSRALERERFGIEELETFEQKLDQYVATGQADQAADLLTQVSAAREFLDLLRRLMRGLQNALPGLQRDEALACDQEELRALNEAAQRIRSDYLEIYPRLATGIAAIATAERDYWQQVKAFMSRRDNRQRHAPGDVFEPISGPALRASARPAGLMLPFGNGIELQIVLPGIAEISKDGESVDPIWPPLSRSRPIERTAEEIEEKNARERAHRKLLSTPSAGVQDYWSTNSIVRSI